MITLSQVSATAQDLDDLSRRRANLRTAVKQVWSRISKSHSYFPPRLQRCFSKIRHYLEHVGRPDEVGDNLVSSCIFLRYLCPAILSPSLFGLTDEYPGDRANRSLTLIAKALQTLANFSRYDKEASMEFLNGFLDEESEAMRRFLRLISSPLPEDAWLASLASTEETGRRAAASADLGRHLANLQTILSEHAPKITAQEGAAGARAARLRDILDDVNSLLHRPTIPQLEQISQPTMTTLRQVQEQAAASPPTSSSVKSPSAFLWSWTLPKPRPRASVNITRPAAAGGGGGDGATAATPLNRPPPLAPAATPPRNLLARPETVNISSNEENNTSSSSASLSPSPGSDVGGKFGCFPGGGGGRWPPRLSSTSSSAIHRTPVDSVASSCGLGGRRGLAASSAYVGGNTNACGGPKNPSSTKTTSRSKCLSSMSLDDTDSSDDSTYSSQCQSDAAGSSTPGGGGGGAASQTLPRPLTGGGGGYAAHSRHRAVHRGCQQCGHHQRSPGCGGGGHHYPHQYVSTGNVSAASASNANSRTLGDYEREILELRSAMESLQAKLGEAERKLAERRRRDTNDPPQPLAASADETTRRAEDRVREAVNRLAAEEDKLRRDQQESTAAAAQGATRAEKEALVLMQQRKVATLEEAEGRLAAETARLGGVGHSHSRFSPSVITVKRTEQNMASPAAPAAGTEWST
jgi:hypothetical protein